jgi:ATP-binding cassette subfamily C protein CydC
MTALENTSALDALIAASLAPHRRTTATAIIAAVAAAVAAVVLLGLSGWFITGAAIAGAGGIAAVQAFNYLLPSAAIRALAIVRTLARYGERLASHRAALLALATLRTGLFAQVIGSRAPAALAMGAGDTAARLVHDVDTLEDMIVRRPALPVAVAAGLLALGLAAPAGGLVVLLLALVLAVVPIVARAVGPRLFTAPAQRLQAATALLKQDFVDYAGAAAEIRAYRLGPQVAALLEGHARRIDAARRDLARGDAALAAILAMASGSAIAMVLAFSVASLPWTILAALAAGTAVDALAAELRSLSRLSLVAQSKARLAALLLPPATHQPPLAGRQILLPQGAGTLALQPGDRLAISGPSGCGKTRLIESLAGLRPKEHARISIDGHPIETLGIEQLRDIFALSPQNAEMIAGTITDNLRLARPGVTSADMWAALAIACLDDDVRAMPSQLDSWIGDGGARLSGGQRKRLSLARALLAGRPWLLLDEPSEWLDPATEARLVTRLGEWLSRTGSGLIVVSHRPALWALAPLRLDLQHPGKSGG